VSSPYRVPYDCVAVVATDIECGLNTARVGHKTIKYWAPGSVSTYVFLARVNRTWRIVGEQLEGTSVVGGTLGPC
jgi:hypothetical protein